MVNEDGQTVPVATTVRVKRKNEFNEEYEVEVNSDVESPETSDETGWPGGWLPNKNEREVGAYLMKIVDAAVTGHARNVLIAMGNPKDRNGFTTIERLADVYGRNAAHVAMLPMLFEWGKSNIQADWSEYKAKLIATQYLKLHPSNEATMVMAAQIGFQKYHHYHRLLDHLRIDVGENPKWEPFYKSVDRFIGDTHRTQFQHAIIKNENGLAAMSAAGVFETMHVNGVSNQFRSMNAIKKVEGTGKGKNAKSKGKAKNDKTNQSKPSTQNNSNASNSGKGKNNSNANKTQNNSNANNSNKKGAQRCAWCGDAGHKHYECKTKGNGKWDKKYCNKCKGVGHPHEVCATPTKNKK